jgi:hypothetical protein
VPIEGSNRRRCGLLTKRRRLDGRVEPGHDAAKGCRSIPLS